MAMTIEELLTSPAEVARRARLFKAMNRTAMQVSLMLDLNVVECSIAYEPWIERGEN